VQDAITIAADVLEGLSAAHRIGIVHRDVKPPNVFLVKKRPAKLLDFGIAKVLDPKASQITGRGIAIGTPRYMAPEQATGGAVDARTDLYAVGLILFEMITGSGPFDGARDPNEVFLSHIAKPAPALTSVAPLAPAALDSWVARLLAKKPEHRPDDADAVARALRALAADLKAPSFRPAPKDGDDQTLSGGPFDTLEAARTVPSDPPPAEGVRTRTGIGPAPSSQPWHIQQLENGKTLRLDALTGGGEPPTRTAAPVPTPDTPLPVTETPFPTPRTDRRWAWVSVLLAALAAAGAGAAISARTAQTTPVGKPTDVAHAFAAATAQPAPASDAPKLGSIDPVAVEAPSKSSTKMEGTAAAPISARSPVPAASTVASHPAPRTPQKPRIPESRMATSPELPGSGL
jgi:serine/threonine-protein kinase